MGYLHIDNLYKNQRILSLRECYALEKIHGTSAHVRWAGGELHFFGGGEKHERFASLFNADTLAASFRGIGHDPMVVYGEAYGGKQQGMAHRYGPDLRFVAFDVQIGESWLDVPQAADVVANLGLEFVHWVKVPTELDALNTERDAPSEQAKRNGITEPQNREGIVLRPLFEMKFNNGARLIAKHKRDDERETKSPRPVIDPAKLQVFQQAQQIADEWVTPTRLEHVIDKLPGVQIEQMREVIAAMTEDVLREGAGEIVDSREARAAIGKKTAELFKARLRAQLEAAQ